MKFFPWLAVLLLGPSLARPALVPPDPPSGLSAQFSFQSTANSKLVLPTISLAWEAGAARSYLLSGYKILRQAPTEKSPGVVGSSQEESYLDTNVALGSRYLYRVVAVDAKGNSSRPSPEVEVDLAKLPESMLAPEAPAGLTAVGGRNNVLLSWQASQAKSDPISYYRLYRSASETGSGTARDVTGTTALDTAPRQKELYYYRIQAVDAKSRASVKSGTVSAQATGTLPPGPPRKLSATGGSERISLAWEAALPGTAPVSEYQLRRRMISPVSSGWLELSPRPASATAYSESGLEPGQRVEYELRAVDQEGVRSEAVVVSAVPLRVPFDQSQLILMPTAFSAGPEGVDRLGLSMNVGFNYYIGSLFESYDNPKLGVTVTEQLQRIGLGTGTLNVKDSLADESRWLPGLAAGVYLTALLDFGQPTAGATQNVGVSSSGNSSIPTMGGIYVVASKKFGERSAVHLGYMEGNLASDAGGILGSNPAVKDWEHTLRHLLPGGNLTDLLGRMVDPNLGVDAPYTPPNLIYAGLQMPFTLPLGFTKWRTGVNAEFLMPVWFGGPGNQDLAAVPWMLNLHIINLPLFGFEFSFFKFYHGYEVVGFYNLADWSW